MNTMPGPSNGGRTGGMNKKKDVKIVDTMRGACPPHRRKDLDSLIKLFNGDEDKIQAKIQEWWEEPQEQEEKWEDVNKKGAKAKIQKAPFVSRGGSGRAPGRGGRSSRGAGGRGGKDLARAPGREGRGGRDGAERRPGGRGRGPRPQDRDQENVEPRSEDMPLLEEDKEASTEEVIAVDIPTTAAAPVIKGAWSVRTTAAAEFNAPIPEAKPARPAPQAHPEPLHSVPPLVESRPSDLTTNHLDASLPVRMEARPLKAATSSSSANVWATKGSAHLIQAEKPKVLPPPAPLPTPPAQVEQPIPVVAPLQQSLPPETPIETLMPPQPTPSVPAWTSPAKPPKPMVEIPPSPVVAQPPLSSMPTVSAVEETIITEAPVEIPVSSAPKAIAKTSVVSLPTNVLNMGHWETGEDDSQNLDFGFGSFGPDSDVGMMDQATTGNTLNQGSTGLPSNAAQNSIPPAMSPARPPPGLSISGMPPIPANAVLVHELENSLENTSLNPHPDHGMPPGSDRSIPNSMPPSSSGIMSSQQLQAPVLPQQNYGQYSMAGVYGYGSAGNGFMGVPAPVLAGGVIPQKPQQPPSAGGIAGQQQQQPLGSGVGISLAQPLHSGLYGSAGPSSAGSSQVASDTDTSAPTASIPPSIPGGGMPYNPVYYGQQPFHHMGQPQGYNYGYGAAQFGGAGGFGYQQVMGQGGAYHAGAPPYEDQTHPTGGAHHAGSAGGYQKTTGYRGRHSGGQYQNQYNPPSGYGGQPPYGMGYGVDHFNQRGVNYGPQGTMDPYMQQQQQQQQQGNAGGAYPSQSGMHRGNFQDEDQYKKKGGRNNNNNGSNLQQFPPQQHNPNATPAHLSGQGQQQQQQQQQQQHSFGLPQSGAAQSSDTGSSTGGWSNHHGGGWGGGAPSWQGS